DEGALARTRRATHDDDLAHLHGQGDVAEDLHLSEPLVDGLELDHRVGHQVITTRTSPAFTAWPGRTRTSATVPGAPARSSFSIFMASITRSVSPSATMSPAVTATWVIFPGRGAVSVWDPPPAAAPPLVRMAWRAPPSIRITYVSSATPTRHAPSRSVTSATYETPSISSE